MAARPIGVWLFTTDGFYSAVAHRDDPNTVIVRSRVRDDALRLVDSVSMDEVIETPTRDYRYRVHVERDAWASYVAAAAAAIDYDNFKNAVAARQGGERAHVYARRLGCPAAIAVRGCVIKVPL